MHKNSVTVCVPAPTGQRRIGMKKRQFRTYTRDLRQLRGWLKNCHITEIAMDSTGQFWRPLWNVLEGEFARLILVNPQHIKGLNGYKTDPKGCAVDRRLAGERQVERHLGAAAADPRTARSDAAKSERDGGPQPSQEPHRAVVPERQHQSLLGRVGFVWGLWAVDAQALIEAKRDPGWMADYARGRLRSKRRELEAALRGTFTRDQRWLLGKKLQQVEWLEGQVKVLEEEIERRVAVFEGAIRRL